MLSVLHFWQFYTSGDTDNCWEIKWFKEVWRIKFLFFSLFLSLLFFSPFIFPLLRFSLPLFFHSPFPSCFHASYLPFFLLCSFFSSILLCLAFVVAFPSFLLFLFVCLFLSFFLSFFLSLSCNKQQNWLLHISRGQQYFRKNYFALFVAKLCGLLTILSVPSIVRVLMLTRQSSEPVTAFRRYVLTLTHMLEWYDGDLLEPTSG